jgi:DNA-binding CsgD family transcriptional regulator
MSTAVSHRSAEELLVRAADNLRGRAGVPLVFGGFGESAVRVSMSAGGLTSALTSLVIRPARGLGGKAMVQARLLTVPEYGRARNITHDYDGAVLGEGVRGLAVAPLMRGVHVSGLLYAATRTPSSLTHDVVRRLAAEAKAISLEVSVSGEPARRSARTGVQRGDDLSPRLREIAQQTTDPGTRAAILELLGESGHGRPARDVLTSRQREVLALAETGLRNGEIGERLGLSEQTVKTYMRALMERLGARSRQEAVHKYRHGLL